MTLVTQKFNGDDRLAEKLKQSEIYQALGLDSLRQQDPAFTRHLTGALLAVALEIAEGKHALIDHYGKPWPELQAQTEEAFRGLVDLLTRFQRTNPVQSFDAMG